jgi:probable HAF family extracellular repeat protein
MLRASQKGTTMHTGRIWSLSLGLLFGTGLLLRGEILYTVMDLGALGPYGAEVAGLNDSAQMTGASRPPGSLYSHAFLYSNGQMIDLGKLGGTGSTGSAINNSGQIAGSSGNPSNQETHAFLYSSGVMTDLMPQGFRSEGLGINDAGQVVGAFSGLDGRDTAFLFNEGQIIPLGPGRALAINNAGQITGIGNVPGSEVAFLYDHGQLTYLGTLGGRDSSGTGINNAGQIAGWADTPLAGHPHAFLYSNGQMKDLGTLGGDFSEASDINDIGQVVGRSLIVPGSFAEHAFLYSNAQLTDLNDLIDPALGLTLLRAPSINNEGQIAAIAYTNEQFHSYLLTLVPEPSTATLFGMTLFGLAACAIAKMLVTTLAANGRVRMTASVDGPVPEIELKLEAEAELALVDAVAAEVGCAGHARKVVPIGDGAVIQDHVGDVAVGVVEMRRVGEVERLHAELELGALRKSELAVATEIPIDQAGAAERTEAGVAEELDVGLDLVGAGWSWGAQARFRKR